MQIILKKFGSKQIGRDGIISAFLVISFFICAAFISKETNKIDTMGPTAKLCVLSVFPYCSITDAKNYIKSSILPDYEPQSEQATDKETITDKTENDPYADIVRAVRGAQNDYDDGKYPADGTVKETDMSEYKATDSFGRVMVQNATDTKEVNIQKILENGTSLKLESKSEPSVLIYHTHTTECYKLLDNGVYSEKWSSRNTDSALNMIRVGDELARVLTANGFAVIHDTKIYDTAYSGAYDRSRESVMKYLEEYPSIKVTLDVHRDAIYADDNVRYKPTIDINGNKTAQVMIIAGAQEGAITDFPNWEENLNFAVMMQDTVEKQFPGLMRPIFFARRQYNMDVTPYSLLLEFGTDANTLTEAVRAANYMGEALSTLLGGCTNEK